MTEELVQRYDFNVGKLSDRRRRTPGGGIVVDATITRTGVFEYRQPDGTVLRELRPAEEVLHPDALASFAHATVTIDHRGAVTADSWKQVAVGHAGEKVTARDNEFADAPLYIEDAGAIARMDKRELEEVSCGYSCRLDRTPGVHTDGKPYDVVQRGHRGNHIAIGPKGWGRMGADVRMHLDSGEAVSGAELDSYVPPVSNATQTPATPAGQAAGGATPSTQSTNDAAELRGANAALEAENKRLKTEAEKRDSADAKAAEQRRFDAAVKERVTLVAAAAVALGADWKDDGKSADEIRREVLVKLEPELELPDAKADGAEGFVKGAFVAAVSRADRATKGLGSTRLASPGAKGAQVPRKGAPKTASRGDAAGAGGGPPDTGEETDDVVADASDARDQREKDAWKTKAAAGRGGK